MIAAPLGVAKKLVEHAALVFHRSPIHRVLTTSTLAVVALQLSAALIATARAVVTKSNTEQLEALKQARGDAQSEKAQTAEEAKAEFVEYTLMEGKCYKRWRNTRTVLLISAVSLGPAALITLMGFYSVGTHGSPAGIYVGGSMLGIGLVGVTTSAILRHRMRLDAGRMFEAQLRPVVSPTFGGLTTGRPILMGLGLPAGA